DRRRDSRARWRARKRSGDGARSARRRNRSFVAACLRVSHAGSGLTSRGYFADLLRNGHRELSTLFGAFRPALHDRLLLGVEAHPFFAVRVHVAEQAALPAAEAMPRHRHRNRYVDAHHAYFDLAAEFARHVAVTREAGHAIAELVIVDQLNG